MTDMELVAKWASDEKNIYSLPQKKTVFILMLKEATAWMNTQADLLAAKKAELEKLVTDTQKEIADLQSELATLTVK